MRTLQDMQTDYMQHCHYGFILNISGKKNGDPGAAVFNTSYFWQITF
ncbi:MAG: hypothetical protein OQL16_12075 [Gammaproteobacteria bacterium]|nr:hypothetical protein [Gammaproteobacteria bacterium]